MQERLQKIIARAGVTSRRKAEELILSGRVVVNGKVVTELGEKADPETDSIRLDGKPLKQSQPAQYWLLYKPREVVTTLSDPEGRPTVQEFLRGIRQRLFPVGRLDYHSEGLLLLTNDGELAHKVMHASSHLPKVYWVKVAGRPSDEQLERLRQGVYIDRKRTAPADIRRLPVAEGPARRRSSADNPWLEITLIEGRNQQIRKMLAVVDHPVEKLKRVSIGPLKAGNMKPGEMRPLSEQELIRLRRALEEGPQTREPAEERRGKRPQAETRESRPETIERRASRPAKTGRPPVKGTRTAPKRATAARPGRVRPEPEGRKPKLTPKLTAGGARRAADARRPGASGLDERRPVERVRTARPARRPENEERPAEFRPRQPRPAGPHGSSSAPRAQRTAGRGGTGPGAGRSGRSGAPGRPVRPSREGREGGASRGRPGGGSAGRTQAPNRGRGGSPRSPRGR